MQDKCCRWNVYVVGYDVSFLVQDIWNDELFPSACMFLGIKYMYKKYMNFDQKYNYYLIFLWVPEILNLMLTFWFCKTIFFCLLSFVSFSLVIFLLNLCVINSILLHMTPESYILTGPCLNYWWRYIIAVFTSCLCNMFFCIETCCLPPPVFHLSGYHYLVISDSFIYISHICQ